MPFNYEYYSTICLHLENNPPSNLLYEEAWIRVYISTLYYSAYNLLKNKYSYNSNAYPNVHFGLIQHLTSCKVSKNITDKLKNFRDLRVQCDYDDPSIPINRQNLSEAKNYYNDLSQHF
ncbi:MAG: hypothetical protein K2X69_09155 [Silvanigrellaceae bacterium]|nr:hypothetical protein [Silvanigrellaceae bacterium]